MRNPPAVACMSLPRLPRGNKLKVLGFALCNTNLILVIRRSAAGKQAAQRRVPSSHPFLSSSGSESIPATSHPIQIRLPSYSIQFITQAALFTVLNEEGFILYVSFPPISPADESDLIHKQYATSKVRLELRHKSLLCRIVVICNDNDRLPSSGNCS